mmetsp:Transcript_6148/g.16075  ORF Transcript_6148/g.16075 Transcript_6148/m.16075 type:complete len:225 (-) Transcript_6148:869-1543(-)|eukprot:108902-Prymnesium_polylepis.3
MHLDEVVRGGDPAGCACGRDGDGEATGEVVRLVLEDRRWSGGIRRRCVAQCEGAVLVVVLRERGRSRDGRRVRTREGGELRFLQRAVRPVETLRVGVTRGCDVVVALEVPVGPALLVAVGSTQHGTQPIDRHGIVGYGAKFCEEAAATYARVLLGKPAEGVDDVTHGLEDAQRAALVEAVDMIGEGLPIIILFAAWTAEWEVGGDAKLTAAHERLVEDDRVVVG